ncbi:MAG: hypothetical protein ACHQD8_04955 [Chitinophagales bacterium]
MKCSTTVFLFLFLLTGVRVIAQKPFTEGVIIYNVTLESAEHKELKGVYTFTIKGSEIKKELKLNNGYQDIILLNCSTGAVYSLQSKYGRKYAIQLNMNDLIKKQEKFVGFTMNNEQANNRNVAGISASKGNITYRDGSTMDIYYTKEWSPVQGITYERFPNPKFLPLSFSYKDENGLALRFDAEKVEASPVENAVFRIPPDYKMITYKEYKELSQ